MPCCAFVINTIFGALTKICIFISALISNNCSNWQQLKFPAQDKHPYIVLIGPNMKHLFFFTRFPFLLLLVHILCLSCNEQTLSLLISTTLTLDNSGNLSSNYFWYDVGKRDMKIYRRQPNLQSNQDGLTNSENSYNPFEFKLLIYHFLCKIRSTYCLPLTQVLVSFDNHWFGFLSVFGNPGFISKLSKILANLLSDPNCCVIMTLILLFCETLKPLIYPVNSSAWSLFSYLQIFCVYSLVLPSNKDMLNYYTGTANSRT